MAEDRVDEEKAPESKQSPSSARRGRGPGRPFTSETARKCQLSSAQAKLRRKAARMKMLDALTSDLDLGEELVKAFKAHDETQMALIERALKMVGLHYEQSEEGKAQHLNLKAETKNENTVHVKVTGLDEGTGN